MTHLTDVQIQAIADKTIPQGEANRVRSHVESCPQCARELEFQRALVGAIRNAPVHTASRGFTSAVMNRIAPELKQAFLFRLFGGAGRTLAMAAVLAVIAYGLTLNLPGTPNETSGTASEIFREVSSYYGAVKELISAGSMTMNESVETNASSEAGQIIAMTFLVLAVLGLIDRFVLRHFVKPKPRRQVARF